LTRNIFQMLEMDLDLYLALLWCIMVTEEHSALAQNLISKKKTK